MGNASGGGDPAQRANAANRCTEAGLPLSRGGRGQRTVVVRSIGRAAAGRPRGCRGTPGAAEGLQGWGGPDTPRGPGAAGSRPGPARGGRATPRELPGGEFVQQPKEGGSQRGPSKPAGNPCLKSPGSRRFQGRPPGRPCRRVTVLGPRQKAPPGDPRRGPASRWSQPRGLEWGGRGFPETRAGAKGAGAWRSGAGPPGRGAVQCLVWRRTLGPSGPGVSATCPAGSTAAEWPTGDLFPRGWPGAGR